jgi:hypothetical protein
VISQVLYLLLVTYRQASTSLSKKDKDNKSFSIMLSIKFNKWRERSQELKVTDHKKSRKDFNKKSQLLKLTLINKRNSLICLLYQTSNLLMRKEILKESSRKLELREEL